jgi:hypothetical protein
MVLIGPSAVQRHVAVAGTPGSGRGISHPPPSRLPRRSAIAWLAAGEGGLFVTLNHGSGGADRAFFSRVPDGDAPRRK